MDKGVARGADPPKSKCCFKFLGRILAEICLKCIILVTIFKNRQALGALRPQRPLIVDFGNLKLRDVAKFCFSS